MIFYFYVSKFKIETKSSEIENDDSKFEKGEWTEVCLRGVQ